MLEKITCCKSCGRELHGNPLRLIENPYCNDCIMKAIRSYKAPVSWEYSEHYIRPISEEDK